MEVIIDFEDGTVDSYFRSCSYCRKVLRRLLQFWFNKPGVCAVTIWKDGECLAVHNTTRFEYSPETFEYPSI